MKNNLKEQKDIEAKIQLGEILVCDKTIEEMKISLKEYEEGLEQTILSKHAIV